MTKPAAKKDRKNPDNLYQRNGVWWIRYNVGGEKVRSTLGTKSLREAKRLRDQILGKRSAAAKFGIEAPAPRKERTFSEVLDLWLKSRDIADLRQSTRIRGENIARLWLRPYFGKKLMSEITLEDVETFLFRLREARTNRTKKPLSQAFISKIFGYLNSVYRQALKRQWYVGPNPLDMMDHKPRPGPGREVKLTRQEAERLLGELSGALYYKVALALGTGLRWGEVHGLAWEDIALESKPATLRVRRSYNVPPKTKASAATIPLSDNVVALLRCWRAEQGEDAVYLFPARSGKLVNSHQGLGLKQAAKRARITKNVTPHTLRHTFGTWAYESAGDLVRVQRLMRHGSIEMSMRYVHDDRDLRDVVNKLPNLHTSRVKAA